MDVERHKLPKTEPWLQKTESQLQRLRQRRLKSLKKRLYEGKYKVSAVVVAQAICEGSEQKV